MKQYKPGQFVSIGRKLARVYRCSPTFFACECCKEVNKDECPCNCKDRKHIDIPCECGVKLGYYYYPKLICGNQDK